MWDAIVNLVQSLLGANFSKVAGLAGLIFILLGLIPGPIRWGPLVIPRRGGIRSTCAIILGVIFVTPPLLGFSLNTTIGSFNFGGDSAKVEFAIPDTPPPSSGLLIGTANAASRSASYTVSQRTVTNISASLDGPASALYVGDVHLSDPTVFLIFKTDGPNASKIKDGNDYSESKIRDTLPVSDTVLLKSLKQGDQQTFIYSGKTYVLVVNKVIWYIIGDDVATVSINPG